MRLARKIPPLALIIQWLICSASIGASESPTLYLPRFAASSPDKALELEEELKRQGVPTVHIENSSFLHPYQQGLRLGRPGIYFAQPHLATWAVRNHQFTPILKLHGTLKYVLAARQSDELIFEVNDLSGKRVCRESGLNLGTVWFNRIVGDNRLTLTNVERPSIELAMRYDDTNCDAFVISDYRYERINSILSNKYIRLEQSTLYANYAFIAHPEIDADLLEKLKHSLKSQDIQDLLEPYFKTLSRWQNLVPSKPEDYQNDGDYLLEAYWQ